MRVIEVGCAMIIKDGKLLAAQRNPGDTFGGFWEFPGGKKEDGETMEQCLVREVREEMGVEIRPRELFDRSDCVCPDKTIRLFFYFCDYVGGNPQCIDCQNFLWASAGDLVRLKFPEGDADVLRKLIDAKYVI